MLGTIKWDTQTGEIKIKKRRYGKHPRSPGLGRGFRLARLLGLGRKLRLARPLGLGRKFRLARPLLGSGAYTASPEPPSWSQASHTRWPYSRCAIRYDLHAAAGHGSNYSNHPSHCVALPLSL